MELNEKTRKFWYKDLPGGNIVATLSVDDNEAKLVYRFRWYRDDKAFDSADKKSFYEGRVPVDSAHVLSDVMTEMLDSMPGETWVLERGGMPFEAFVNEILAAPFAHAQRVQ
jgi:hypothetical protein